MKDHHCEKGLPFGRMYFQYHLDWRGKFLSSRLRTPLVGRISRSHVEGKPL
jgi:hypothetical protein